MPSCCDPRGCDRFFGDRFARSVARRYRKRGLDKTSRRMVAFLEREGIEGATVLEIGGGIGEIHIELLRRGAAHAVNLELSGAYDEPAAALLREHGLTGRTQRLLHDIAAAPGAIEAADVVVLHRVVCCYPDYERLLGAAADHARRAIVFSHPPRNLVSRAFVGMQNLFFRAMRREFRTFAHPPKAMLGVLEARGLELRFSHRGVPWQIEGLARAGARA